MFYGQNKEDETINNLIVSKYGSDFKGTILDLGANDGVTLSNSRYFYENNWKGRIGDIFWCSDSLTYDILSDFYLELPTLTTYPRGTPPEYTWFNYIKKNQIKIIPNSKWDLHLLR
jgi:hypothetical protein